MAKLVSEVLVDRLIGWSVDTIFGLPGDGVDGIFEGLRQRQDKLKFIQARHEEPAAFASTRRSKPRSPSAACRAARTIRAAQ